MARVVIEVADGSARYRVAIHAGSPRRALSIVDHLKSGGGTRVIAPAIREAVESPARAGHEPHLLLAS